MCRTLVTTCMSFQATRVSEMAKRYYLRLLIRGQEDLVFEVRKADSDRLDSILQDRSVGSCSIGFFWFETIDGKSVAINLQHLQGVRLLWDASSLDSDTLRYDGPIQISLCGRPDVLEEYTDDADLLYDFFKNLEYGPDTVGFPRFVDEDGETFVFNATEIVWVIAPAHLLAEGARKIADESGDND